MRRAFWFLVGRRGGEEGVKRLVRRGGKLVVVTPIF